MASDDELKDEELVDFEGSDYELDGEYEQIEEIEEEEDADLQHLESQCRSNSEILDEASYGASETLKNSENEGAEIHHFPFEVSLQSSTSEGFETLQTLGALETLEDSVKVDSAIAEASEAPTRCSNATLATGRALETLGSTRETILASEKPSETLDHGITGVAIQSQNRNNEHSCLTSPKYIEGAESGKCGVERGAKEEIAMPRPPSTLNLDDGVGHLSSEVVESRFRKLIKPDLEDGELDESAVPQNYGFDAEEESKDEVDGRERKRRKDTPAIGQGGGVEGKDVKELDEASKQQCNLGSDKALDHFAELAGGRGLSMRMIGLAQGSLAPGIMGPGRPLIPLGIGSFGPGFGPFGVISPPGRPQVHLQEVLAQEHLFRAHALQLAQETLASAIRAPITRPLGAAAFQPFLGFDILGPRPHGPKHFARPPPDLMLGHMGNLARGQRPSLGVGIGSMPGKIGGQGEPTLNNSIGRQQFGWSPASVSNELQPLKRGRGRGRGIRTGLWGDAEAFGPGGLGNPRAIMNVGASTHIRHLTTDEGIFYQTGLAAEREVVHNEFDARWKIERERMLRNGLPPFRTSENNMLSGKFSDGFSESGKKTCGKVGELKPLSSQESSRLRSLAARLGPPTQAKVANVTSSNLTAGSNVIKLHQPVRKSRVLTVSGLPEDTPMSTVAEVFEKLGKITDFKKNSKGDAFTISYSNETEAVTAKRSLHRSTLAGKQITVDYAHQ